MKVRSSVKKMCDDCKIIKRKGETFYGIAIAVNTICESILKGTSTIRTVGTVLNGEYGESDVVVNVPSIISKNGVEMVLEIDLTDNEKELMAASANAVRSIISEVKDL